MLLPDLDTEQEQEEEDKEEEQEREGRKESRKGRRIRWEWRPLPHSDSSSPSSALSLEEEEEKEEGMMVWVEEREEYGKEGEEEEEKRGGKEGRRGKRKGRIKKEWALGWKEEGGGGAWIGLPLLNTKMNGSSSSPCGSSSSITRLRLRRRHFFRCPSLSSSSGLPTFKLINASSLRCLCDCSMDDETTRKERKR